MDQKGKLMFKLNNATKYLFQINAVLLNFLVIKDP